MRRHWMFAIVLACAACPNRQVAGLPPTASGVITKGIPAKADLDILFVIDNSLSTGDKQVLFAQNFQNFVGVLDTFAGGVRPNLHIGVVSTTVGTGGQALGSTCPTVAPNDDGKLHATPVNATVNGVTCSAAPPNGCTVSGNFIIDVASNPPLRDTNYSCPGANPLATALPCIAELGTGGCGFEAPLEAMKRALDGSVASNNGFVRDGAYLAIIVLTDEDDCSVKDPSIFSLNNLGNDDFRCQPLYAYDCDSPMAATAAGNYTGCKPKTTGYLQDVGHYYDFLTSVKPASQIAVAVIGGVDAAGKAPDPRGFSIATGPLTIPGSGITQPLALQPQCMTTINDNPAIARPGLRLADFVSRFGTHGGYYSVCQSDYTPALNDIANRIKTDLSMCLEGKIDTQDANAADPGLQPQCTVSDVLHYGSADASESYVGPCEMTDPTTPAPGGARPCWWLAADPVACPDPVSTPSHLVLHIERSQQPPDGTTQVVSCVVDSM